MEQDRRQAHATDGPTLETYVETRFNMFAEALALQAHVQGTNLAALKALLEASALATDLRYQQRFDAQSDALTAAFSAAKEAVAAARDAQDRAVLKAEVAADKRFESVNEFRKTLADQQQTFMPRAEVIEVARGLTDKLAGMKEQVDRLLAERLGIKGGWGYAVGLVGFLVAIMTVALMAMRFFGK